LLQYLQLLQFGPDGWGDELALGLGTTLALAVSALPIGLLIGLGLAFASHARNRLLRESASAFAGMFRGIPELLALFLVYIGGQRLTDGLLALLGLAGQIQLGGYLSGTLTLGIVFGAYSSEIFLGILRTLDASSIEAARALGLGRWPILRFVILPELFRLGLPGLSNQWLSTIKQSALVSVVACDELLRNSYLAASSSGKPLLFYGVACLVYIGVTTVSETGLAAWHRHLSRGRTHG
jgi:polar amino acid transport system permease protein